MLRALLRKAQDELVKPKSRHSKRGHSRTLLVSGTVGLISFALSDVQNGQSRVRNYLTTNGLCITWERWSNAFGVSRGLTTESAHVFRTNSSKTFFSSTTEFQFSSTLKYTCITVADTDTNGQILADQFVNKLPFAVSLTLADVYSAAAEKEPCFTGRSPGELPNPVPNSLAIDSAIEEAFELVNEKTYSVPRARRTAIDADLDEVDSFSISRRGPSDVSLLMGIYNHDDQSLRVAFAGNAHGHVVFGRRVTAPSHSSPDCMTQVKYEVEELAPPPTSSRNDPTGSPNVSQTKAYDIALPSPTLVQKLNITCTTRENVRPGDFAVFGNTALWKYLTKEEVVALIGQWMQEKKSMDMDMNGIQAEKRETDMDKEMKPAISVKDQTPSHRPAQPTSDGDVDSDQNARMVRREFTCQDGSVSLHLLRNALRLRGEGSLRSLPSSFPEDNDEEEEEWAAQEKVISEAIEKEGGTGIGFTVVLF